MDTEFIPRGVNGEILDKFTFKDSGKRQEYGSCDCGSSRVDEIGTGGLGGSEIYRLTECGDCGKMLALDDNGNVIAEVRVHVKKGE